MEHHVERASFDPRSVEHGARGGWPPNDLHGDCPGRDPVVMTREMILNSVAIVFDVDALLIEKPTRGRARTALARQVAMYLAHVGCELPLTAVGRIFGRDRSTVAHACRRVEDAREKPQFDRAVSMMEQSVRTIVKSSPAVREELRRVEQAGLLR